MCELIRQAERGRSLGPRRTAHDAGYGTTLHEEEIHSGRSIGPLLRFWVVVKFSQVGFGWVKCCAKKGVLCARDGQEFLDRGRMEPQTSDGEVIRVDKQTTRSQTIHPAASFALDQCDAPRFGDGERACRIRNHYTLRSYSCLTAPIAGT